MTWGIGFKTAMHRLSGEEPHQNLAGFMMNEEVCPRQREGEVHLPLLVDVQANVRTRHLESA